MPHYDINKRLNCDFWLQLWDIQRAVQNDTTGVVEELKKLTKLRYFGRPVSIYGGMADRPLIVTNKQEVRWFDKEIRDGLNGGK